MCGGGLMRTVAEQAINQQRQEQQQEQQFQQRMAEHTARYEKAKSARQFGLTPRSSITIDPTPVPTPASLAIGTGFAPAGVRNTPMRVDMPTTEAASGLNIPAS